MVRSSLARKLIFLLSTSASGLDNGMALTPALGYNSWNHLECHNLNAANIKKAADALAALNARLPGSVILSTSEMVVCDQQCVLKLQDFFGLNVGAAFVAEDLWSGKKHAWGDIALHGIPVQDLQADGGSVIFRLTKAPRAMIFE
eukprot:GEMP01096166.1.p1 GENE.GEMP01096166.1~~GEMP01096166.1.p1  ORF type:complete len:145 (+),score=29.63 GEMP01096166.1:60-494(+)